MKNSTKQLMVLALFSAIFFLFIGCGDSIDKGNDGLGTGGDIHQWGEWVAIKAATETEDGEEKRTCALDPTHTETRTAYATGTEGLIYESSGDYGNKESYVLIVEGIKSSKNTIHIPAYYIYDNWLTTAEYERIYLPVTEIGTFAFEDNKNITTVTFQEGSPLQTVGYRAFKDCTNLKSIELPAGLTTIRSWAFDNCTKLTEITVPASVTVIEVSAFYDWVSSQTIYIKGFTSQTEADAAWGENWRKQRPISLSSSWSYEDIAAQIVYQGGQ
jgi:hypothetical protein